MTHESMSRARFLALAQAYGGHLRKWPERERDAAAEIVHEAWAQAILHEEGKLDGLLDAWTAPAPSEALAARVRALAQPLPRPVPHSRPRRAERIARWWWSGIGVLAAAMGIATGAYAAARTAPVVTIDETRSAFGDPGKETVP